MNNILNCGGHKIILPDIIGGDGIWVHDRAGNYYMDLESGVWCLPLGHNNGRINSVIRSRLDSLMQSGFCYTATVVEEAAGMLLQITGMSGGKAVFLCSGSEAIEVSRQIVQHLTGRRRSMTLSDSYLGAYSSVNRRDRDWFCFDWSRCASCPAKDSCSPDCPLLEEIPDDIADFIFEPGSSSGYVRFPPARLIENIAAIVRAKGGRIIVNEVTTGLGRTGRWFGCQHYPIRPDIIAAGKGLGNGYPVSAACLSEEIAEELERKPFKYAQSHMNSPLGAAVAAEVLRIIDQEKLIQKAEANGVRFLTMLEELCGNSSVLRVRGRGLMFAADFEDQLTTGRVYANLIDNGFLTGNRGTSLRIDPPLITDLRDFEDFTAALHRASS